jgi:type I restriction enzyme S subunit
MNNGLPQGWLTARISELCDVPKEKGRQGVVPYLEIGNVNIESKTYTLTNKPSVKGCRIARRNDVLVSKVRPTRGAIIWIREEELQVSSAFTVLRNKGALAEKCLWQFLAWNSSYLNHLGEKCTGTMYPTTSDEAVVDFEMPLPPLNEQQRIVAKLKKLLNKVGACQQRLAKIPELLKRFRQSTLNAGLTGSFTQDLNNGDGLEFQERAVAEVCSFSQGVQVDLKNQFQSRQDGTVRFLRIIDFTQGTEAPRFVVDPGSRYHVSRKDLSMVRYGASTGFVCRGLEGVIANNLFRIFPSAELDGNYLYYFFKSDLFRRLLVNSLQGVAMPAINFKFFKDVSIRIPSLSVQQEIVRRVEGLFALADQIEARYAKGKAHVEKLTQSILAKAFRGELVPQDPNDEPAEKLLERIKGSRNGSKKTPRSRTEQMSSKKLSSMK